MNDKLANIETLQRIKALERSMKIKRSVVNNTVSTLLTSLAYSISVYYLFTHKNSLMSQVYNNYLSEQSFSQAHQNINASLHPLVSSSESDLIEELDQSLAAITAADIDEGLAEDLNSLYSELKHRYGDYHSVAELLTELEEDTDPSAIAYLSLVKNKLMILAVQASQALTKSLPEREIREHLALMNTLNLGDMIKLTMMTSRGINLVEKKVQKFKNHYFNLWQQEFAKKAQYIFRARYVPELIGLFATHFFLVKPVVNRLLTPITLIPENEYLTERQALSLIKQLTLQQIILSKRSNNIGWYSRRFILPSLLLGYLISDADTPLFWLITFNMLLISFSEWIYSDPFETQQKIDRKNCQQNQETLTTWLKNLKDFKIDAAFHLAEDPHSSYVMFNFSQDTNKQLRHNNKILSNLFQQLLSHHQVKIEYADSYKVIVPLAQSVTVFNALSQMTPQRLSELLVREQQINLLLSQIKKLDEYLFLSVDCEIETSALMEKSNLIKIYLPASLNEALLKTLADKSWLNEDQTLTFKMAGPIPDNVFIQWLGIFEAHSLAKLDRPSSLPVSQHQEQKETLVKLSQRKIVPDLKAAPKMEIPKALTPKQPIRWRSAMFDPSKTNNYVVPVENGFGRHYTLRLFSEKNCPKDVFPALKHIISDRVKFVGDTGQQGLKRTKLRIKNQAGDDVPATRKAKVKGFFGKVRAAAYEERAETGEVLHIFTAKNIYKGH